MDIAIFCLGVWSWKELLCEIDSSWRKGKRRGKERRKTKEKRRRGSLTVNIIAWLWASVALPCNSMVSIDTSVLFVNANTKVQHVELKTTFYNNKPDNQRLSIPLAKQLLRNPTAALLRRSKLEIMFRFCTSSVQQETFGGDCCKCLHLTIWQTLLKLNLGKMWVQKNWNGCFFCFVLFFCMSGCFNC